MTKEIEILLDKIVSEATLVVDDASKKESLTGWYRSDKKIKVNKQRVANLLYSIQNYNYTKRKLTTPNT